MSHLHSSLNRKKKTVDLNLTTQPKCKNDLMFPISNSESARRLFMKGNTHRLLAGSGHCFIWRFHITMKHHHHSWGGSGGGTRGVRGGPGGVPGGSSHVNHSSDNYPPSSPCRCSIWKSGRARKQSDSNVMTKSLISFLAFVILMETFTSTYWRNNKSMEIGFVL